MTNFRIAQKLSAREGDPRKAYQQKPLTAARSVKSVFLRPRSTRTRCSRRSTAACWRRPRRFRSHHRGTQAPVGDHERRRPGWPSRNAASIPNRIPWPRNWAGPENAADCPNTMRSSSTPGSDGLDSGGTVRVTGVARAWFWRRISGTTGTGHPQQGGRRTPKTARMPHRKTVRVPAFEPFF